MDGHVRRCVILATIASIIMIIPIRWAIDLATSWYLANAGPSANPPRLPEGVLGWLVLYVILWIFNFACAVLPSRPKREKHRAPRDPRACAYCGSMGHSTFYHAGR